MINEDSSIRELDELIKSIKEATLLDDEGIAKRLNYNLGYIAQTRSRGKASPKMLQKIRLEFKDELQNAKKEISPNNNSRQTQTGLPDDYKDRAIYNLTESHRELSSSYKELVGMVKNITAGAGQETRIDAESKLTDILGLIAMVASGTHWQSEQEAFSALSKLFHDGHKSNSKTDTHGGLGKLHKGRR